MLNFFPYQPRVSNIIAPCLILITLLVVGCSSQPNPNDYRQQFLTKITDDGSKWFLYKVKPVKNLNSQINKQIARDIKGDQRQSRNRKGDRQGGEQPMNGRQQRQRYQVSSGRFDQMLELYLNSAAYCREGFIKLDKVETANSFYFWGECQETATARDEAKWPNNGHFDKERE
ncbi:hypothetical protein [Saccharobesus litoralis]|nr:hypothetical protein [Saccharobesus litoralis]